MSGNDTIMGEMTPFEHQPRGLAQGRPVLVVFDRSDLYVWFPIDRPETRIGREEGVELELQDETSSRVHATIKFDNFGKPDERPRCFLRDNESRNGTFVNGRRIFQPAELENGDRIFIGKTCLVYYVRTEREINSDQKMQAMATRDALTGLLNRGFMSMQFQREYDRARRYERPLALMMIDLDDFKKINDSHGHQVGDAVLEQVAQAVASRIRVHDIAARYGGEEFSVLLPETTLQGAAILADRMRKAIAGQEFIAPGRRLAVTVSVGVAELDYSSDTSFEALVHRADMALLHAKRHGKNRVSIEPLEV